MNTLKIIKPRLDEKLDTLDELVPFFYMVWKKHGVRINDFSSVDDFIQVLIKKLPLKTLKKALYDEDGILDSEIKAELHRREV